MTDDEIEAVVRALTPLRFGDSVAFTLTAVESMANFEGTLRRELDHLVARVERTVWAERLVSDTKEVSFTEDVTVYTPGRRVWWAPWRRHPDVAHRVTVYGMVDVTVEHFAAYPDFVPTMPDHETVRYSTIQQAWRP